MKVEKYILKMSQYSFTNGTFQDVKLTTHLHLVPGLRMCGAVLPLPYYAFMPWCLNER
jgi:hypothetical protein